MAERVRGALGPSARSVRVVSDAAERYDRRQVGAGRRSRPARNWRQVLISAGVGLFSGGTQRTALVIVQSISVSPSSGSAR